MVLVVSNDVQPNKGNANVQVQATSKKEIVVWIMQ